MKTAGLLARPVICTFPSPYIGTVAMDSDTVVGLTAAGTAPAFHRIPFSFLFRKSETEIPNSEAKIEKSFSIKITRIITNLR